MEHLSPVYQSIKLVFSQLKKMKQSKTDAILVFGMVLMALTSLVFLVAEYVD